MDEGEDMLDGLAREIREETGIEIDTAKVKPFFTAKRYYKNAEEWVAGIFYIVQVGISDIKLSSEHISYTWIDPRQQTSETADVAEVIEAYRKSEGIVVAADDEIKGRQGYGLVQVFTGNGKGKTTAGLGCAIRALGAGKKVGIVYFDKGGDTHYFEREILDLLLRECATNLLRFIPTGRDRIDPITNRFDFSIQQIDKDEAERGLGEVRKMFQENYDLIILDEINSTTDLGILSVESVLSVLDEKPEQTELILTGRNAPDAFLDRAHLVTEMRLRKHYFYSGVKAREGLDF